MIWTTSHVDSFGKIAGRYGQPWTAELVRTWFAGNRPAWAYAGGQERPRWIADRLPGLCARLHASGQRGTAAAQQLVDLAWEWTAKDIGAGLASSSPSRRDEKLGDLARPLASVLTAAAAIGAASPRDAVCGFVRKQGDAVTALEMPALRAAAKLPRAGPAARPASATWPPTARRGSAPGSPSRNARPATGRSSCPRAAATASCAAPSANSSKTRPAHLRMAARQGAQAARPLPDRRRRTARHPRDQAARPPLHTRPEQDRRALHPRAGGAEQGRNGSGLASGTVRELTITSMLRRLSAPADLSPARDRLPGGSCP